LPGQLAAGRIDIITARLARRGDDSRLNQYLGETPDAR
jgi:hypothetical protein